MELADVVVFAGVVLACTLALATWWFDPLRTTPRDDSIEPDEKTSWTIEWDGKKFWRGKKGVFDRSPPSSTQAAKEIAREEAGERGNNPPR